MGVFYGNEIFGIRITKLSKEDEYKSDIVFEIKFDQLTESHMNLIKDAFNNNNNEMDEISYYFYRTVGTSHEWCSNSDEVLYYMWTKSTKESMIKFIEKNNS